MEGNLNITFAVNKKSILDKIAINSYYRGERLKEENGAHAARMQAGVDNEDVLKDEIGIAAADVAAMITRNLGRCTVTEPDSEDGSYEFVTKGASNFPEELKSSIEGAIASYLFDKALEGWLLINMPAEVQALAQRSVADAEKLRQLLVERSKPIR